MSTSESTVGPDEAVALGNAGLALRLVAASLPHLAGLCHAVRVRASVKYPVAAIGATGLMLVNPRVFAGAPLPDLAFVVAHELLHLALDTFGRAGGADPHLVNVAHDYVINDILSVELGREVPFGGLVRHGARRESLEALAAELARGGDPGACWTVEGKRPRRRARPSKSAVTEQLERLGLVAPEPDEPAGDADEPGPTGDTLSAAEEAALEPHLGPRERTAVRERVRREAVRSVTLKELRDHLDRYCGPGPGDAAGATEALVGAVATAYRPPWQLALQRWLDAVAPGQRSFARPSRRGADRADGVVPPGRTREGWALHVVLDTSGSMAGTLPHVLGLLAAFCEGAGVTRVHVLQCDAGVTADDWLDPAELAAYRVTGFGGSDMGPALDALAVDPEVSAVLVLTDGFIAHSAAEPPYAVLWGIVDGHPGFAPPYGTVVQVKT
jgi:predicted metal-dependent peptidase